MRKGGREGGTGRKARRAGGEEWSREMKKTKEREELRSNVIIQSPPQ